MKTKVGRRELCEWCGERLAKHHWITKMFSITNGNRISVMCFTRNFYKYGSDDHYDRHTWNEAGRGRGGGTIVNELDKNEQERSR